jgi:hypothetical protein
MQSLIDGDLVLGQKMWAVSLLVRKRETLAPEGGTWQPDPSVFLILEGVDAKDKRVLQLAYIASGLGKKAEVTLMDINPQRLFELLQGCDYNSWQLPPKDLEIFMKQIEADKHDEKIECVDLTAAPDPKKSSSSPSFFLACKSSEAASRDIVASKDLAAASTGEKKLTPLAWAERLLKSVPRISKEYDGKMIGPVGMVAVTKAAAIAAAAARMAPVAGCSAPAPQPAAAAAAAPTYP